MHRYRAIVTYLDPFGHPHTPRPANCWNPLAGATPADPTGVATHHAAPTTHAPTHSPSFPSRTAAPLITDADGAAPSGVAMHPKDVGQGDGRGPGSLSVPHSAANPVPAFVQLMTAVQRQQQQQQDQVSNTPPDSTLSPSSSSLPQRLMHGHDPSASSQVLHTQAPRPSQHALQQARIKLLRARRMLRSHAHTTAAPKAPHGQQHEQRTATCTASAQPCAAAHANGAAESPVGNRHAPPPHRQFDRSTTRSQSLFSAGVLGTTSGVGGTTLTGGVTATTMNSSAADIAVRAAQTALQALRRSSGVPSDFLLRSSNGAMDATSHATAAVVATAVPVGTSHGATSASTPSTGSLPPIMNGPPLEQHGRSTRCPWATVEQAVERVFEVCGLHRTPRLVWCVHAGVLNLARMHEPCNMTHCGVCMFVWLWLVYRRTATPRITVVMSHTLQRPTMKPHGYQHLVLPHTRSFLPCVKQPGWWANSRRTRLRLPCATTSQRCRRHTNCQ